MAPITRARAAATSAGAETGISTRGSKSLPAPASIDMSKCMPSTSKQSPQLQSRPLRREKSKAQARPAAQPFKTSTKRPNNEPDELLNLEREQKRLSKSSAIKREKEKSRSSPSDQSRNNHQPHASAKRQDRGTQRRRQNKSKQPDDTNFSKLAASRQVEDRAKGSTVRCRARLVTESEGSSDTPPSLSPDSTPSRKASPRSEILRAKRERARQAAYERIFGWVPRPPGRMALHRNDQPSVAGDSGVPTMNLELSISIKPSQKAFQKVLSNHNIATHKEMAKSALDKDLVRQRILKVEPYEPKKSEELEEFAIDLEKCEEADANEATFQRTTLMTFFDRFDKSFQHMFDWSAESIWMSEAPPFQEEKYRMPQPRPDLCIAFRTHQFCQWQEKAQMEEILEYMIPVEGANWAFPFVFVEAKGTASGNNAFEARNQNLNVASRALWNIWVFMDRSERLQERFLQDVRVFSIVASPGGVFICMHKAERSNPPTEIIDSLPSFQPLSFLVKPVVSLTGDRYTKQSIRGYTDEILKYASDTLLGLLKDAVKHQLSPESYRHRRERRYKYDFAVTDSGHELPKASETAIEPQEREGLHNSVAAAAVSSHLTNSRKRAQGEHPDALTRGRPR